MALASFRCANDPPLCPLPLACSGRGICVLTDGRPRRRLAPPRPFGIPCASGASVVACLRHACACRRQASPKGGAISCPRPARLARSLRSSRRNLLHLPWQTKRSVITSDNRSISLPRFPILTPPIQRQLILKYPIRDLERIALDRAPRGANHPIIIFESTHGAPRFFGLVG